MSIDYSALNHIRDIDLQVARQVIKYEQQARTAADGSVQPLTADAQEALESAVLMLNVALGKGQVCLPLSLCLLPELNERWQYLGEMGFNRILSQCYTVFDASAAFTDNSENAACANQPVYANQPLVLSDNKLYLARYYFYQLGVLTHIRQRLNYAAKYTSSGQLTQAQETSDHQISDQRLTDILQQLFGGTTAVSDSATGPQPDWQKVAAASACVQNFAVITGGPGTGKTTTVTRLLSALLSINPDMTIALAAPTGKAAARMTESIRGAKLRSVAGSLPYAEHIPDDSFTLHRLLGWSPRGFRYNADRHLPFDCVVVDEASMVDLPMMFHLFNALATSTRLILLGDRDQLASVEAGSVLADLCDAGRQHGTDSGFTARLQQLTGFDLSAYSEAECSPMQNAVSLLRVSHRFDADSGIGRLAQAVNHSDEAAAAKAFSVYDNIAFEPLPQAGRQPYWQQRRWQAVILDGYGDFCRAVNAGEDAQRVFNAFNQFQVLVALRQGIFGVEQVNLQIERLLAASGYLATRPDPLARSGVWYAGRPVMISRNDYDLGLFNGDIGIALPFAGDGGKAELKVAFPDADGAVRWLLPSRLPAHETAFAMTVHKSQGSEFEHLCLLLPDQWQSVITRELIYTAITRAKQRFQLFASDACWAAGLSSRVQRASGLRDALWPEAR